MSDKRVVIEYFKEEEEEFDNEEAETVNTKAKTVNAEVVEEVEEVTTQKVVAEETPAEEKPRYDDLEDYVFHFDDRDETLELINYLPRVPKPVLKGERDFTAKEWEIAQEDYNRGFRPIEDKYVEEYQVPNEGSKFRVPEHLSKEICKVSTAMVRRWLNAIDSLFPPELLKDDFGFTKYTVAILRNLMRYTCTRVFIPTIPDKDEKNTLIDWDNLNRDDSPIKNPEVSKDNPLYVLSSVYWEKLAQQWEDYCDRMDFLTEYKKAQSLREQEPEVINLGNDSEREFLKNLSHFAAQVEIGKQAFLKYLGLELDGLNRQAYILGAQKGAEGRAGSIGAYAEAFNQSEPPPLEEEEDIWVKPE